jgi:CBS domain-containing protein
MRLFEVFTRGVITAAPEETLAQVAGKMQEHNVGTVVVVEGQRPVGILTDRDLALALGARGVAPQAPARQVMTPHVLAVPEDTSVFTATKYVRECQVRRLPVVDSEDRVVGLVSLDDLLRLLAKELHNLAEGITREMEVK